MFQRALTSMPFLLAIGAVLMLSGASVAWWHGLGVERASDLTMAAPGERATTHDDDSASVLSSDLPQRADTSNIPPPPDLGVRTFLLVGVGVAGMDVGDALDIGITDARSRGSDLLTDTMMLLVTNTATSDAALVSLPRDLWVPHRGQKLNAVLPLFGQQALVDDVMGITGVPIHHYVQLNFAGFVDVVDAIGGVELAVDRPLRDSNAHLHLPEAGCYNFDGQGALSYVRSRSTQTLTGDGSWVVDEEASDFGRQAKQRRILAAMWDQLRGPQLVPAIPTLLNVAGGNVVLDRDLGIADLVTLARTFQTVGSGGVEQHAVPAVDGREGGAWVVFLADEADELFERLRDWPPAPQLPPSVDIPSVGNEPTESEEGPNDGQQPAWTCEPGQPRMVPQRP